MYVIGITCNNITFIINVTCNTLYVKKDLERWGKEILPREQPDKRRHSPQVPNGLGKRLKRNPFSTCKGDMGDLFI